MSRSTADKAHTLLNLPPDSFDKIQLSSIQCTLSNIHCTLCQLSRWVQDTEASPQSPYAACLIICAYTLSLRSVAKP